MGVAHFLLYIKLKNSIFVLNIYFMTKIIKEVLYLKDTQNQLLTSFIVTKEASGEVTSISKADFITQLDSAFIPNSEKGVTVATLIGGKLDPLQVPDLAITSVQTVAENTLAAFVINNGNYTFEQGDVIIINDGSGNLTHYMFDGGDKGNVSSYSLINATEISISQVNGLQAELDSKLNLTGGVLTGDLTANNFAGNGSQLTNVDAEKVTTYNIGSSSFTETLSDFDDNTALSGIYRVNSSTPNNPIGSSGVLYQMNSGADGYISQMYQAISSTDIDRLYIRHWIANTSTWSTLKEILHTGQENIDFTAPNDVVNIKGDTKTFLSFDTQDDILTLSGKTEYNRTIAEINTDGPKTVVTKEWVEANAGLSANFYEEGTFTPTISGLTTSSSEATYVRTGNSVVVSFKISGINGVGGFLINNLPFTCGSIDGAGTVSAITNTNIGDFNLNKLLAKVAASTNNMILDVITGGTITGVTFTNSFFKATVTYKTNVYTP